jgi:hypothetical protein
VLTLHAAWLTDGGEAGRKKKLRSL